MTRRLATGLLGAAAGLAAVTLLARVVGFGRTAVLGRTVGPTCVGDVYTAVNAVPNVVFEVVAGGALAGTVVPVLAGALARGDRAAAGRTAGALLTWTLLLLAPATLLVGLAAPLVARGLLGQACPGAGPAGTRMLLVFLPQIALYGVAVVLTGVLQAHRRFLGPALAPLLSSVVVAGAYLLYAAQDPTGRAAELTRSQELTLSVGTTLGVAVLAGSLLLPLRRTGLRLRPGLRFPPGVASRARGLAAAGVAGLAAQQLALVVALRLAAGGDEGSVVVLALAIAVFLVPWAVLAVPLATSAFPLLSASAEAGDDAGYAVTGARTLRATAVASAGAAAVLAAAAVPASAVLLQGAPGGGAEPLGRALLAFAPGLLGYGLAALLTRALLARGAGRTAATGTVVGWLSVVAADLVLVAAFPDAERVLLLGLGHSLGVTVGAGWLLVALRRAAPAAVPLRPVAGSAAAAAVAAGAALALPFDGSGSVPSALVAGTALAAVAGAVHLALVRVLDPAGVRSVLRG